MRCLWRRYLHHLQFPAGTQRRAAPASPSLRRKTFIIRSGTGLFTLGDQKITAAAGQILVAPPNTPHKFTNVGPGPLETIDIHANGKFITEWLE